VAKTGSSIGWEWLKIGRKKKIRIARMLDFINLGLIINPKEYYRNCIILYSTTVFKKMRTKIFTKSTSLKGLI